jgi:hypothetical protein
MSTTISVRGDPQVYGPSRGDRIGMSVMAAFVSVMGAVFIWGALRYFGSPPNPTGKTLMLVIGAAFVALGALVAVGAWRWKTLYWSDRITSVGLFYTQTLLKAEISGYRLITPSRGRPMLKLFSKGLNRTAMLVTMYRNDPAFSAWYRSLTDLDAVDRAAREKALMADTHLGATPDERRATLKRMSRISHVANGAGWAILLWAWLFPQPYALVMTLSALAPLVAIGLVRWSQGAMTLGEASRTDPRPGLAGLMFGGYGLVLRAVLDLHTLDWIGALIGALVVAAVASTASRWAAGAQTKVKPVTLVLYFVATFAYGWGLVLEADRILDRAPAHVYPTQVTDMHISSGKHTSYDITLAPWGPTRGQDGVDVGRPLYQQMHVGETVCPVLHPGALHIRWWEVGLCEDAPTAHRAD